MKELSLYGIRDRALESGRGVFSVQELANLIGKPKRIATVYASRLAKKGLAWKLLKGKLCFERDDFIVATQLVEPSYVSLGSALLFHGIVQQVPKNVECVTTKNSLRLKGLGLVYHKIPSQLFFGFRKHLKGRSYVMVAEPEKAVLDALYLNVFSENDLRELRGKIGAEKLRSVAKKFSGRGSKKLWRLVAND